MARFPNRNLNQTAVYWGNPQPDGTGGYTWDDPIEIDSRWIYDREVMIDNQGEEIVSHAQVRVAQDLDENGMLFLGTLNDLDSDQEANPGTVTEARKIRQFRKVPLIQGNGYSRKAML
jgi:hypothetical protein